MGARRSKTSKAEKDQQRITEILQGLDDEYPDVNCSLHHHNPYQLLMATFLAAQCNHLRVTLLTPPLFDRYPPPPTLQRLP